MKRTILFLGLFILLLASVVSQKTPTLSGSPHLDNYVLENIGEEEYLDVIIRLKDDSVTSLYTSAQKASKEKRIAERQAEFIRSAKAGAKEMVSVKNHKYLNAVSAKIKKSALERIIKNPSVDAIYYNYRLVPLLQDSTKLINASDFWSVNISGISVNGTGETVCVIDTGINYEHPYFGNPCESVQSYNEGEIITLPYEDIPYQSPHPYPPDANLKYKINYTGFTRISVHFDNIVLENGLDTLLVLDKNNKTVMNFTGTSTDLWSPTVEGDTLYIVLNSDLTNEQYGFRINKIANGTANQTINWSSCDKFHDGWDFFYELSDPVDMGGHGSHVAGIIASEHETYRGIAPGASLVVAKVTNDANQSYSDLHDIVEAIAWCVDQKDRYNISVISISMGSNYATGSGDYCDAQDPLMAEIINYSVASGVAVVVASGNDNDEAILTPACTSGAIAVGATTKAGVIDTTYSNYGEILDLVAPGSSINSIDFDGTSISMTGTSMAAPHVSAAALLLRNFKRLENGTILTPDQIRSILKSTGTGVVDSRDSRTYPRLNLTAALSLIDDTPKIKEYLSGTFSGNISVNYTYINVTASEPLVSAFIELDMEYIYNLHGSGVTYYLNLSNLTEGTRNFTINLTDTTGKKSSTQRFFLEVNYNKPDIFDISNYSINATSYQISWNTTEPAGGTVFYGISPATYSLSQESPLYETFKNITLHNLLPNTTYFYYINVSDSAGNTNYSEELNFTTEFLDIAAPSWSARIEWPENNSVYSVNSHYQFNITWEDFNLSDVWVEHNLSGDFQNESVTGNSSGGVFYLNKTGLAAGGYLWRMHANDTTGNMNSTPFFSYFVQRASSSIYMTLNRSAGNWNSPTLLLGDSLLINATLVDGEGQLSLFINGQLANESYSNITNYYSFSSGGMNNVTALHNMTMNYTFSFITLFVNVTDTDPPQVNITSPQNNSVVEISYNIPIIFSTDENSICTYRINQGTILSPSTSDSRYFTARFNATYNGRHNITLNCTDTNSNTRLSRINFTISDTDSPSASLSVTDTVNTLSFTFTTDEPANKTISVSGQETKVNSTYIVSHGVTFTGLSQNTEYEYNITLCDYFGNCDTISGEETTDRVNTGTGGGSSGGTGGGSSTSSAASSNVVKVSQMFIKPKNGTYAVNVPTVKISFTQLQFRLMQDFSTNLEIVVEKIDTLPTFVQRLGEKEYQYIKVDKSGAADYFFSEVKLKFRVEKSWLSSNNIDPATISLYRFTSQWDKLQTRKISEDTNYIYYESDSPGLSYFGIMGNALPQQQVAEPEEVPKQETGTPTGNVVAGNTPGSSAQKPGQKTEEKTQPAFLAYLIPLIILGGVIGGVFAFLSYQKGLSLNTDSDLKELRDYVQKCKSEGIDFSHIKDALLKAGWSESITDLALHDVHVPSDDIDKIDKYILFMRDKKVNDEQIRGNLRKVGWQEEVLTEAFSMASVKKKK